MNTQYLVDRHSPPWQLLFCMAILLSSVFSVARASDLTYSDLPLFYSNGIAPNVALIIDNSGSMTQTDTGGSGSVNRTCTTGSDTAPLTRIQAAKNAACQVVNDNAASMRIALYTFSTSGSDGSDCSPSSTSTTCTAFNATQLQTFTANNATAINSSINGLGTNSNHTPLSTAYNTALGDFFTDATSPIQYRCQKNFIVLFTDGHPNIGMDGLPYSSMPAVAATSIQQSSTWPNSTAKTGLAFPNANGWSGFPNVSRAWQDGGSYTHNWAPWSWLDDLSQMAYDVDIKNGSSATVSGCPSIPNSPGSSVGKDCAGKSWNGTDDTGSYAASYNKQNIATYDIGFGTEGANQLMRDTPLVNQILIVPAMVNTVNNTITVAGHGLNTGDYIQFYSPSSVVFKGIASTGLNGLITVSSTSPSSFNAPQTGTPLTYSNNGGTALNGVSSATYYAVNSGGSSTTFSLATSAANAVSCAAGTMSNCFTITNIGNSNQTFTTPTTGLTTIGGLYAYTTDQEPALPASVTNPVPSSGGITATAGQGYNTSTASTGGLYYLPNPSTDAGARGKYYVEVLDANTIRLHQCMGYFMSPNSGDDDYWSNNCIYSSSAAALTALPLVSRPDLDSVTGAVKLTSTGYGIISTGPGKYFNAVSAQSLSDSLQAAFLSISGQTLSQASLTANVAKLTTGSFIYSATFNTKDWSGDIAAYALDSTTGAIANSPTWTASSQMPGASLRKLYTMDGTSVITLPAPVAGAGPGISNASELAGLGNGAPASLTSAQQGYVVNWMRGTDTTAANLPGSRTRSNNVYGDIMDSSPVYVGPPSGAYDTSLPSGAAGQSTYATFKSGNSGRTPMLYVGANDGFMHGINANSGAELFGYVPRGVYIDWVDGTSGTNANSNNGQQDSGETTIQKFYELTQAGYGHVTPAQPHRYFVDGKATVGDAYFSTAKAGLVAGKWHTVLVGGLGRGGRSIYALDVTLPASFAATNVLWEFDGSNDAGSPCTTKTACMGYTFSRPQIARVCTAGTTSPYACTASQWVAIFGNGYDSASDSGHLYIVNLEDGTLIKRLDTTCTTTTTGCGLSSVAVFTPASGAYQGVATGVYAGDLNGNVWKFDLSNPSSGSWTASKLFAATDGSNVQPITAAPTVVDATLAPYSLSTGEIVIVGTGTYFQASDKSYDAVPVNDSLYSIWDKNDGATVVKTQLQQQTMSLNSTTGYRSLSNNTPSCGTWYSSTSPCSTSSAGSRGWYINLVVGTAYDGERVVFTPLKVNYVLFFDTVIPKNIDPCTGGGTSWLYGVDAKTGGSAAIFTGLGNAVSGLPSTVGVMSDISFIATSSDGLSGNLYVEGSNGTFVSIPVNTCPGCSTPTAPANGRMTWRQLQ